jgi:diguanylate cyclase (GGDEF)-like protein
MLCGVHTAADRWEKHSYFVDAAVGAFLIAFTLRLALTQYHQQQEIAQRKEAQNNVIAANLTIGRLLDDVRRQNAEISEFGNLLQACASDGEAFRVIPERLRRLLPNVSGALSLLSASRDRVESVTGWGPFPPVDQIFTPNECWSLRRGCVHAIPAGKSALRCTHLMCEGASICLPLIANGETIGVLALQDDEPPADPTSSSTTEDFARRRQMAVSVAEHIALALSNLQLREALRVQAVRDPLTGLYNRRYMQEFLEREIHRARRRQRPVAVMMLDLDNFKRYNDTYGHSAGDLALRMVGETLLSSVRGEDLACRYGGEEFVLMLPECSLQQAVVRGDVIRKRLKELPVDRPDEFREAVTVSIGVAAFEETTDKMDRILKCADEALYQAKREGRDRVVAARPVS